MMGILQAKARHPRCCPRRRHGALIGGLLAVALSWVQGGVAAETTGEMAPETTGETVAPVQAIWKQQDINFYFHSFTTFYSCRSLADKVERLLIALGATQETKVRSSGCYGNEIARMPYLRIKLTSPIEATPAALAELEKTRSTRELAARVRGERAADPSDQFPAHWKRVSLSRGEFNLEPGDCELIDQLKRKVLPKLAVHIVKDDMQCTPNQLTLGQPRLEVEALAEIPKPDQKALDQKNLDQKNSDQKVPD